MNKSFLCFDRFLFDEISNFTIEITQQCNFRCSYCCYSGEYSGMRKHANRSMEHDTILKTIEFIKSHAHKTEVIVVSIFGGEALLQLNQIVFIVEELSAYFKDRVVFDISTNGLLLSSTIVDKLIRYKIGISVSVDGCKTIHDKNRKTIDGKGTFNHVVDNLLKFKERYPNEYQDRIRLLVTVGSIEDVIRMNEQFASFKKLLGNKPPLVSQIYPNYKKKEFHFNDAVIETEFLEKAITKKKNGVFDFYTIILDSLLKKAEKKFTCSEKDKKIYLRTCLDNMYSIFIDAEGRLYPCEKFDTSHYIGDLETGVSKKLLYKWSIIYNFRRSILCSNCKIVEYCSRCLADLKMSFVEQKEMCKEYKKNIELALMYNHKLKNNA